MFQVVKFRSSSLKSSRLINRSTEIISQLLHTIYFSIYSIYTETLFNSQSSLKFTSSVYWDSVIVDVHTMIRSQSSTGTICTPPPPLGSFCMLNSQKWNGSEAVIEVPVSNWNKFFENRFELMKNCIRDVRVFDTAPIDTHWSLFLKSRKLFKSNRNY